MTKVTDLMVKCSFNSLVCVWHGFGPPSDKILLSKLKRRRFNSPSTCHLRLDTDALKNNG